MSAAARRRTLAGQFLGKEVKANLDYLDPEIPPTATIEGVDLVTEGVITINRVLTYAESYLADNKLLQPTGAISATALRSLRGCCSRRRPTSTSSSAAPSTPRTRTPTCPSISASKCGLWTELSEALKKMGKRIKVSYF